MHCRTCKNPLLLTNKRGVCILCLRSRWAKKREENDKLYTCAECGVRHGQRGDELDDQEIILSRANIVDVYCFGCNASHRVCEECHAMDSVARGVFGAIHIGLQRCPARRRRMRRGEVENDMREL